MGIKSFLVSVEVPSRLPKLVLYVLQRRQLIVYERDIFKKKEFFARFSFDSFCEDMSLRACTWLCTE